MVDDPKAGRHIAKKSRRRWSGGFICKGRGVYIMAAVCCIMCADQGDYDGRGQQSCKCNFIHFYKEARPAPMLTFTKRPGPYAHTAWAVIG